MGSNLGTLAPHDTGRADPRWLKHTRDMSLEQLFAAGDAVDSLLDHPGWISLQALIDAEITEIDRRLDGRDEPLSQAEYAMAHGRRSGLKGAADAAAALMHRYTAELERQRARHEDDAGAS